MDSKGRLPLLAPMSEVAGKIATQAGAFFLEKPMGGRGVLLGGVPGVAAATVLVIGGGVVGQNAAFIAIGMEADVFVFDRNIDRLRELDVAFGGRASTVYSSTLAIEEMLPQRRPRDRRGARARSARAVRDQARPARPDEAARRCWWTCRSTRAAASRPRGPPRTPIPVYEVDGVTHYCVTNMPGAVPVTSTFALTNATLPYVLALADHGVLGAIAKDPGLRPGVNVAAGQVTHPAVAEGVGVPYIARRRGARRAHRGLASREKETSTMATATKTKLQNFIDGEFVDAADGATDAVTNPATGEQIAEMPLSTEEDVNRAVKAAAQRAFDGWSTATPGDRSLAILKLADSIEEHADELADLEAADAGKPRHAFFDDEVPFMVRQPALLRAARRATWRARPPASTCRATPRSSAARRSAWWARSPPGTTR